MTSDYSTIKKMIYGLVTIIMVTWLPGCAHKPPPTGTGLHDTVYSAPGTRETAASQRTVEQYLTAVIKNDRKTVLALLSGEALQTTSNNYRIHKPSADIKLDSFFLAEVSKNTDETFSIIDASVIYSKNDVLNRQLYRFYLTKAKDTWKIFKVEARQVEPPALLEPDTLSDDIKSLITDYVKTAFTSNTSQHDKYLTGPALQAQESVNNSFGTYRMEGYNYDNLTMQNIGSAPGFYLVRSTIDVTKPDGGSVKREHRILLFEIIRINDSWRINRVYLEGVETLG